MRRVAIVTGSTRGIGLAIAKKFDSEGVEVVINGRSQEAVDAIVQQLGGKTLGVAADISQETGAQSLIDKTIERFGRVDILVNNAGMPMKRPSLELSLADWQTVIANNMTSVFLCSQRAGREMMRQGQGAIVNIASVTSFGAFPQSLGYATTKAALVMMTKVLAVEWAPTIRVNSVAPGVAETEFTLSLRDKGLLDFEKVKRRTPMGRLATTDDISSAVFYLASESAGYITGETLKVDGGWLAYVGV